MSLLDKVKARLPTLSGDGRDALICALLDDATDLTLSYLGRSSLPEACQGAVIRLAVILYNRVGMEGETSHTEGGVSISGEALPEEIKALLRPYRVARTV